MNAVRRKPPADDRLLYAFIAASLAAHAVVFFAGRVFKPDVQRVLPVYNVTLVTSVPGGGKRADAPSAKGSPEAKAAEAPAAKAAEPEKKAAPAKKPEAKPAPAAKKETRPVPKAEKKKPDAKKSAGEAAPGGAAAAKGAKQPKAQDLGAALQDVKGLIRDKQRGSESGMEGGRSTAVGEFGAGQGGAQVGALALQIYMGQVQNAIQKNWRIPGELARLNIVVQLGLRVGADGALKDVWVDEASGVGIFDESAMRAVRAASPLPVPPQTKNGYFEFYTRFTPQGARSN